MLKAEITILLVIQSLSCIAQELVEPGMMWMPKMTKNVTDYQTLRTTKMTVSALYISTYPESNYQYQIYLEEIKQNDSLYQAALPNSKNIPSPFIDQEEKIFLTTTYLFDQQYSHYPLLGLSSEQVTNYYNWKEKKLNQLIAEYKELYASDRKLDTAIIQYTMYEVPIFPQFFCALQKTKKNKANKKWKEFLESKNEILFLPENQLISKEITNATLSKLELEPSLEFHFKKMKRKSYPQLVMIWTEKSGHIYEPISLTCKSPATSEPKYKGLALLRLYSLDFNRGRRAAR